MSDEDREFEPVDEHVTDVYPGGVPVPVRLHLHLPTELAVRLSAMWDPAGQPEGDDDNGCSCGGESDGRPVCNCGDGCSCDNCNHYRHARARTCSLDGCEGLSVYRLVPWQADGVTQVHRGEIDPGPAVVGAEEWIVFGEQPSEIPGGIRHACGKAHAVVLAENLRAFYDAFRWSRGKTRVRIESWTYEPDVVDLPGPLWGLRESARVLASMAESLAQHRNKYRVGPVSSPVDTLGHARRYAARVVETLAALDAHHEPPVSYTGSIPADVDEVRAHPDRGPVFARRMTSGWYCAADRGAGPLSFDTDEALLDWYSTVWAFPRPVLVVPGEPTAVEAEAGV